MTKNAAVEASVSHTSWVVHSPARPGCAAVADAIASIPIADSASAAAIVGMSSLSSSRRCNTVALRAGGARGPQSGGAPRRRLFLLGKPVLEEDLQNLARDRRGGGAAV